MVNSFIIVGIVLLVLAAYLNGIKKFEKFMKLNSDCRYLVRRARWWALSLDIRNISQCKSFQRRVLQEVDDLRLRYKVFSLDFEDILDESGLSKKDLKLIKRIMRRRN